MQILKQTIGIVNFVQNLSQAKLEEQGSAAGVRVLAPHNVDPRLNEIKLYRNPVRMR